MCSDGFQDNDGDGTCSESCASGGLACGNNEACFDESGTAACDCAIGYQDNDANDTCAKGCAGFAAECGAHGVCRDESGAMTCVPIVDGLLAHYDAQNSDSITAEGSNLISQWDDISGNEHHLTVNPGALDSQGPPSYDVDINTRPAVNFAAAAALYATSVSLSSELTVFAVIQWQTSDRWGSIAHHGDRDLDWALEQNSAQQGTTYFQSNNDTINNRIELTAGNNYILVGRIEGNERTYTVHSIEGGTMNESATGVSITTGDKPLYLGASHRGETSNVHLGELVYYSRPLSSEEVDHVTRHLRERWDIYENLALAKSYAYGRHEPGADTNLYLDDTHTVHTTGLGGYSAGDLTDGLFGIGGSTDAAVPSPVVGLGWTGADGSQPTDIFIDLDTAETVRGIAIGTSLRGSNGGWGGIAPQEVAVSFSASGDADEDFGDLATYPLWDHATEPLSNGHHSAYIPITPQGARYVKLSFDGWNVGDRYILDEVSVLGLRDPPPN